MLGIRLGPDAERRLQRHASDAGRSKSVIVRDWIMERLEREEVDALIRNATKLLARERNAEAERCAAQASTAFLQWQDAEDGGYDWGPDGPPDSK